MRIRIHRRDFLVYIYIFFFYATHVLSYFYSEHKSRVFVMRQSIVIMARHRIAVLSTVEKTAISRSFRFSILLLKKVSVCFSRKNVMVPSILACRKNWGSRTVSWELSDFFLYIFAYEKIRVWPPLKKHKRDFSAQTCNVFVTFENLDSYSNHVSYRNREFEFLYISVFYRWYAPKSKKTYRKRIDTIKIYFVSENFYFYLYI